jgi:hypothetical protein
MPIDIIIFEIVNRQFIEMFTRGNALSGRSIVPQQPQKLVVRVE